MQMIHPYAHARVIPPMRPATFAGLMELYECNYILLKQLFDDHDPGAVHAVDCRDRRYRLESSLLERGPYTTTVLLSYSLLDRRRRPLAQPVRLKIRVYHDARQAELFRPARPLRTAAADAIAVRWSLNKFLNGVLTLFSRRGARLIRRSGPAPGAATTGKNPEEYSHGSKDQS